MKTRVASLRFYQDAALDIREKLPVDSTEEGDVGEDGDGTVAKLTGKNVR